MLSIAARSAVRRLDELPGARVRRVRRAASAAAARAVPRASRSADRRSPREIGVRTIDVDEIAGTAVGTSVRRGADFLPLRPFRTRNWQARWQRIRQAIDRLTILPPIDVFRYDDRYWVQDGHNRVAAAKYGGQIQIDANVVDLVPPGEVSTQRRRHPGPGAHRQPRIAHGRGRAAGRRSHPRGPDRRGPGSRRDPADLRSLARRPAVPRPRGTVHSPARRVGHARAGHGGRGEPPGDSPRSTP